MEIIRLSHSSTAPKFRVILDKTDNGLVDIASVVDKIEPFNYGYCILTRQQGFVDFKIFID